MTKVIVVKIKDGERPSKKQINSQLSKMIEGAANEDGSWKRGWEPALLQCYIKKEDVGVYTFVHNLDRLDYSLNLSPIKMQCKYSIIHQGRHSFTFEAKDNEDNYIDIPFRFAISIVD